MKFLHYINQCANISYCKLQGLEYVKHYALAHLNRWPTHTCLVWDCPKSRCGRNIRIVVYWPMQTRYIPSRVRKSPLAFEVSGDYYQIECNYFHSILCHRTQHDYEIVYWRLSYEFIIFCIVHQLTTTPYIQAEVLLRGESARLMTIKSECNVVKRRCSITPWNLANLLPWKALYV